ncbi:hypothetical protein ACVBGC_05830 [Burkholderia stagnalis]
MVVKLYLMPEYKVWRIYSNNIPVIINQAFVIEMVIDLYVISEIRYQMLSIWIFTYLPHCNHSFAHGSKTHRLRATNRMRTAVPHSCRKRPGDARLPTPSESMPLPIASGMHASPEPQSGRIPIQSEEIQRAATPRNYISDIEPTAPRSS